MKRGLVILFAFVMLFPAIARADCANPSAPAGKMIYNTDHSMVQYCDGTDWIPTGQPYTAPSAPTNGLVGHWKLDETSSTTAADSSGNGNTGTMQGGLDAGNDAVTGQVDGALDFDGSNDYISIANESDFDFEHTDPFSIGVWVYRDTNNSEDDIFEKINSSIGWRGYALWMDGSDNDVKFDLNADPGYYMSRITTGNAVPLGTWTHVMATYDGSSTVAGMKIYINGVEASTTYSGTSSFDPGDTILNNEIPVIGNAEVGSSDSVWDGQIDDVRIYNRELSAAEIEETYQAGLSLNTGLVGHWKLDETSGTSAADSSGNGNNGTMGGGLNAGNDAVTGKVDGALDFDGSDDRSDIPTNSSLQPSTQLTLSAWVKLNNYPVLSSDRSTLIAKNAFDNSPPSGYFLWAVGSTDYEGGNTTFAINENSGGGGQTLIASQKPVLGAWTHIAATYDATGQMRLYFNGVLDNQVDSTQSSIDYTLEPDLYIGGHLPDRTNYLDGQIDDVRIYNRALSADEVGELFCTKPGYMFYNQDYHVMEFCSDQGIHTMGPVADCSSAGDLCKDGSIFAGDTNLYVTDANQSAASQWKNATGTDDINPDSTTDGQANHDNRGGTLSDFPAFELCENLSRHGYTDWYLPAEDELDTLYTNRAAINASAAEDFTTAAYWSSTENNNNRGRRQNFGTGAIGNTNKDQLRDVRCVRRGATPASGSGGGAVPTNGLVGRWKLDETSGSNIADSSGNGNDGTWDDSVNNNVSEETTSGKVGTALNFDGNDDYISVPDHSAYNIGTDDMTLSAWINVNSSTGIRGIANQTNGSQATNGWWWTLYDGYLIFSIDDTDHEYDFGFSPSEGWIHVATVKSGTTVTLYKNGVAVSPIDHGVNINDSSANLRIGMEGSSYADGYFDGQIDDFLFYNRALSASEIQDIYKNPGLCSNPDGVEGKMIYNADHNVAQYCNGMVWIGIGK